MTTQRLLFVALLGLTVLRAEIASAWGWGPRIAVMEPLQFSAIGTGSSPEGGLDAVERTLDHGDPSHPEHVLGKSIRVRGWARDADGTGAVHVRVTVDGELLIEGPADHYHAGQNANVGFDLYAPDFGWLNSARQVCAVFVNQGYAARDVQRCFDLPAAHAPIGALDSVTPSSVGFRVRGWALDPDLLSAVDVIVTVDSGYEHDTRRPADAFRPDLAASFGTTNGAHHGFDFRVPIQCMSSSCFGGQDASVCVWAVNAFDDAPLAKEERVLLGCMGAHPEEEIHTDFQRETEVCGSPYEDPVVGVTSFDPEPGRLLLGYRGGKTRAVRLESSSDDWPVQNAVGVWDLGFECTFGTNCKRKALLFVNEPETPLPAHLMEVRFDTQLWAGRIISRGVCGDDVGWLYDAADWGVYSSSMLISIDEVDTLELYYDWWNWGYYSVHAGYFEPGTFWDDLGGKSIHIVWTQF